MGEELFLFAHENARQNKIAICFAKLPQQNLFEIIESLLWVVACISCVKNVPKDLFGQVGKSVRFLSFWDLISAAANCALMGRIHIAGSYSS